MILIEEGQSPLVLCLPHSGTDLPETVSKRLNATGRLQADLSWRLERVFDFHKELDVTVLRSSISRFVIDPDKDAQAAVQDADLCPVTTLDGKRIYQEGEEPGPTEIEQRVLLFYDPFHRALRQQVDRLLRKHSKVVLLDCQSMRSHIKGVTDEDLPVANIGSADGSSCSADLRNLLVGSFQGLQDMTVGVDEHIKGGFITRSFGRPEQGLDALTLLLAQRAYLRHESPPFEPDKSRMARLRSDIQDSLSRLIDWTSVTETSAEVSARVDTLATPTEAEDPTPAAEQEEETRDSGETPIEEAGAQSGPEVIPADPAALTRGLNRQTGEADDGTAAPLLVAE